jgi:hypothetical protein
VRSFLARHGILTNNKIKVEEYCIKPKNSLFILGTLGDNPGLEVSPQPVGDAQTISSFSTHGLTLSLNSFSFTRDTGEDAPIGSLAQRLPLQSDAHHEVLHLSSESGPVKATEMSQQQKIAAALLKAGISSPAAWSAPGLPATGGVQVLTEPMTAKSDTTISGSSEGDFNPRPPVVLMKGTNNKTFLISWRSQQEVARALGWKCALMIWGGPTLALISLYFLLGIKALL